MNANSLFRRCFRCRRLPRILRSKISGGYSELREPISTRENCYPLIWWILKVSTCISEKSSRRDEVSAHEESNPCPRTLYEKEQEYCNIGRTWSRLKSKIKYHYKISQNCVSKCTRLHLSAYSFQNISGGACPRTPCRKLLPFGLLSQILDRTLGVY